MAIVNGRYSKALLENVGNATGTAIDWIGGEGTLYVEGTLDGATVALETRTPNDTWVQVSTTTTVGVSNFDLPKGDIRAVSSGGGLAVAGIYVYVRPRYARVGQLTSP